MISKCYNLSCDTCGKWIDTVETSSIDKAVRLEKKTNAEVKITKRVNGTYYIECADCAKENKNEK